MTKKDANSGRTSNDVKLHEYIEEIRAKQRNTVWPDPLRNSRAVDEFLWRGSSKAPLVQRVGALIFGLAYILSGAGLAAILFEREAYILLVLVAMLWLVAGKMLLNVVRK
jgi:hypothetical protein